MDSGIYCFYNKTNHKRYIGQSKTLTKRYEQHIERAFKIAHAETNSLLHKALRKYGIENFEYFVIEKCDTTLLDEREKYWITFYNTIAPNGYNITRGGSNASVPQKISYEQLEQITELLFSSDLSQNEIAKKFNVSENMICGINSGYSWHRDLDYPIRKHNIQRKTKTKIATANQTKTKETSGISKKPPLDILIKEVYETSFVAVGQKYKVSDKAVSKWCASYGIPHTIKELREYYKIHYLGISEQAIQEEKDLKQKHAEQSQPKTVVQCDLKTKEELQTFDSCLAAARYLIAQGITTAKESSVACNIGRVISGQRNSAYKFYWKQLL